MMRMDWTRWKVPRGMAEADSVCLSLSAWRATDRRRLRDFDGGILEAWHMKQVLDRVLDTQMDF